MGSFFDANIAVDFCLPVESGMALNSNKAGMCTKELDLSSTKVMQKVHHDHSVICTSFSNL